MKEIRLTFYQSTRKNSMNKLTTFCTYCSSKNGKNLFTKDMDFYDAVDKIVSSDYKYITISATNYSDGYFFSANDMSKFYLNTLDIPESKRYNREIENDLIQIVKLIYYYMILLGADFDYTYNPFTDSNVIYHLGKNLK